MIRTCYNCGLENDAERVLCGKCGKPLGEFGDILPKDVRALSGQEHVLFDNGEIQVTTEAVLIGMRTDAPDVLPLDAIYDARLEEGCVVLKVKYEDDHYCVLDEPEKLATLIHEQIFRRRYAHRRKDDDVILSD